MRLFCAVIAIASLALLAAGCGREVSIIPPDASIHLSGRWNDSDSREVSNQMIETMLSKPWITDFRERTGRKPVVRVSQVDNRSGEEIATQIFTNDIERALIDSGRVSMVGAAPKPRSSVPSAPTSKPTPRQTPPPRAAPKKPPTTS
jgi:penicillin-binding protein activator